MSEQIQVRRGTAAEWAAVNPLLAEGEWGYEKDTGRFKIGDGVSTWSGLGYRGVTDTERTAWGAKEGAIASGTTAQYFRGDKTWQDLFAQVRAATLTGLSTATATAVSAADSVLSAIGKLQAQVSSKADSGHTHGAATTSASGFMSATDKAKLDGVAVGATNYTHPSTHSPDIISQDANNRFVTDAEKAAWSAKQAALGFTPENAGSKGAANGYAGLGADARVPASQLPLLDIADRAPIAPTLDLDFARQRYRVFDGAVGLKEIALADILTYTGSGRAYTDALGALKAQSSNVPRLEFDPVTGAGLGLSVWGARTNLLLNSLLNGTPLATQSVTLTAVAHRLSFYGTGTVTLSGAAEGVVVGSGSYPSRSGLTFTPSAGSVTFTVSGTVQFAMLTTGSVDSPFVPTAGTAVTATADLAQITGSNFGKWFNPSEGTFVVWATSSPNPASGSGSRFLLSATDASNNNLISFPCGNATQTQRRFDVVLAGVNQAQFVLSPSNGGVLEKAAGSYGTDNFAASSGGAVVQSDLSGSVPTVDRLNIGGAHNTGMFGGTVSRVLYFPRALPNHLQALSA